PPASLPGAAWRCSLFSAPSPDHPGHRGWAWGCLRYWSPHMKWKRRIYRPDTLLISIVGSPHLLSRAQALPYASLTPVPTTSASADARPPRRRGGLCPKGAGAVGGDPEVFGDGGRLRRLAEKGSSRSGYC